MSMHLVVSDGHWAALPAAKQKCFEVCAMRCGLNSACTPLAEDGSDRCSAQPMLRLAVAATASCHATRQ